MNNARSNSYSTSQFESRRKVSPMKTEPNQPYQRSNFYKPNQLKQSNPFIFITNDFHPIKKNLNHTFKNEALEKATYSYSSSSSSELKYNLKDISKSKIIKKKINNNKVNKLILNQKKIIDSKNINLIKDIRKVNKRIPSFIKSNLMIKINFSDNQQHKQHKQQIDNNNIKKLEIEKEKDKFEKKDYSHTFLDIIKNESKNNKQIKGKPIESSHLALLPITHPISLTISTLFNTDVDCKTLANSTLDKETRLNPVNLKCDKINKDSALKSKKHYNPNATQTTKASLSSFQFNRISITEGNQNIRSDFKKLNDPEIPNPFPLFDKLMSSTNKSTRVNPLKKKFKGIQSLNNFLIRDFNMNKNNPVEASKKRLKISEEFFYDLDKRKKIVHLKRMEEFHHKIIKKTQIDQVFENDRSFTDDEIDPEDIQQFAHHDRKYKKKMDLKIGEKSIKFAKMIENISEAKYETIHSSNLINEHNLKKVLRHRFILKHRYDQEEDTLDTKTFNETTRKENEFMLRKLAILGPPSFLKTKFQHKTIETFKISNGTYS